jgi:hypothetical protein
VQMATTTPLTAPHADSKRFLGRAVLFGINALIVYTSAVHLSPWLVYHWFGWVAPTLQVSIGMPSTDWYLQHLEIVTIIPALLLGYVNATRFFPAALGGHIRGESDPAAPWAWVIPTIVLGYKMVLYDAPSSVLYGSSMSPMMSAIKYFFDIQKVMPTRSTFLVVDSVRVLAQMLVTAPFYAGVAYSLGAFASKYELLTKLFKFERIG